MQDEQEKMREAYSKLTEPYLKKIKVPKSEVKMKKAIRSGSPSMHRTPQKDLRLTQPLSPKPWLISTRDSKEKALPVFEPKKYSKSPQKTSISIKQKLQTIYQNIRSSNHSLIEIDQPYVEISQKESLLSCLLYTSPSPRDRQKSRMPSSA
eukprot:TRINITY_DN5569_c0_g1_i3.p1 TRINITY_DN5569_c0_g1~~TRINITY_DN5569_c0_g1_i3.p1  ORF type:complete len:151 (-),score=20.38 TRINITY_DN5569_c0_g1_i3:41-493(-)